MSQRGPDSGHHRGGEQSPAAEGQDHEHGQHRHGGGHASRAVQEACGGRGAAEVDAQEHRGGHADEHSGVGQPERGQGDQHQAGQGDADEKGPSSEPGHGPGPVWSPSTGYGGELLQHLGGPRQVGVDRADREHQRGHRGHRPPGRADGQLQQVGQRHGQIGAAAQAADRRDGQAQVEHRGHGERDADDPGQLARAQPSGQRGHGLPADEREHQGRGRPADGQPAVRGERGPVRRAGRVRRAGYRGHHHRDQQGDEQQLRQRGRANPAGRQPEHREQQPGGDGGASQRAAAGQRGHVTSADETDDRRAGDDAGQEPPPGHRRRAGSEPGRGVARRAGRARHRPAQRSEHRGEDRGQGEQPEPGEDRRGPGLFGGQAGQQQESGPEEGADIQRGGPWHRQREGLRR